MSRAARLLLLAPGLLAPGLLGLGLLGLGSAAAADPRAAAPAPPPAPAPRAVPAGVLARHDSNAPVDVDADRIEVQDRADRAIFSGNVRARQADMTLTAARITVAYTKPPAGAAPGKGGDPQIQRMDATGAVVVTNPTERATGDYAIYDLDRKLVTMLGNVVLTRAGNVVRGGRAVLDLNTNRATVDGSSVGGGASAAPGGRVSGRFTVPQRATAAKPGT